MAAFPSLNKPTTNSSVAAAAWGTPITSGAANTYGSWTSIGPTPPWPSYMLLVNINSGNTGVATRMSYVDIGIGPDSANVTTIIEKLSGSAASSFVPSGSTGGATGGRQYVIPILIPPNTELWARQQNVTATSSLYLHVSFSGGKNPGVFPVCSKVVALGAVTATTEGTAYTPGNATEGGVSEIVASTARDYVGFLLSSFVNDTTGGSKTVVCDMGIGGSGAEVSIAENFHWFNNNTNESIASLSLPIMACAPAGSRLVVRGACNTTPDSGNSMIINAMVA
jgi:hypothetical protein